MEVQFYLCPQPWITTRLLPVGQSLANDPPKCFSRRALFKSDEFLSGTEEKKYHHVVTKMTTSRCLTNFWHIYWWHLHPLDQFSPNMSSQCVWDFAGVTFVFAFLGRSSARRTRSEANVWPSSLRGHKTGVCSTTTYVPFQPRAVLSTARRA